VNCLEFRRRLGSDPGSNDAAFVAHRESCVGCAAAYVRAQEFEQRMQHAFAVSVPSTLADRILLAQTTGARRQQRRRSRGVAVIFAAAACLVIVLSLAYRTELRAQPLGDLVVEHVLHHEPEAVLARAPIDKQRVSAAFADRGVAPAQIPDGISYVHECPVGPYRTVHMVMPAASGAVSVVYVVDDPPRERRDFQRDGMHGRELPLGDGALVMVAGNDRDFDAVERAWTTAWNGGVASIGDEADAAAGGGLGQNGAVIRLQSVAPVAAP
jgi:hypothetical protein